MFFLLRIIVFVSMYLPVSEITHSIGMGWLPTVLIGAAYICLYTLLSPFFPVINLLVYILDIIGFVLCINNESLFFTIFYAVVVLLGLLPEVIAFILAKRGN